MVHKGFVQIGKFVFTPEQAAILKAEGTLPRARHRQRQSGWPVPAMPPSTPNTWECSQRHTISVDLDECPDCGEHQCCE